MWLVQWSVSLLCWWAGSAGGLGESCLIGVNQERGDELEGRKINVADIYNVSPQNES